MRRGDPASDGGVLRVVPLLVTGLALIAVACGLGAWIYARGDTPFAIDTWWNTFLASEWSTFVGGFSFLLNFLGGGWFAILVVPIGGAIALILLKRPWSAAYFLAAQAVSAGVVQLLKSTFGRARPEDILVLSDFGSYPSGHVAGAATLATAIVVLFPRVFVIVAGSVWVVLMAFTRTYVHAHWLSDTLGGALVGVGTALVVAAIMARMLAREIGPMAEPRR